MGEVNKMVDSVFAPILNSFVDEGKLSGWGQLNHAWGDEYVKQVSAKHPDAFGSMVEYFQEHKDNIYSIRNGYSGK